MAVKILRLAGCVLLLSLLPLAASFAQDVKPIHLYVGGGLSIAGSSIKSAYQTGFHGVVGVGFKLTSRLQIQPRLEFDAYKPDGEYWVQYYRLRDPAIDTVTGGTLVALLGGVEVQYHPFSPSRNVRPFLSAGGGWANLSNADFLLTWAFRTLPNGIDSRNRAYGSLGAGMEFGRGTSFTFFLQARYVSTLTRSERYNSVPVTFGLRF